MCLVSFKSHRFATNQSVANLVTPFNHYRAHDKQNRNEDGNQSQRDSNTDIARANNSVAANIDDVEDRIGKRQLEPDVRQQLHRIKHPAQINHRRKNKVRKY